MIVESPNKVKKIKTFLGPGWDVAASVGHVRDLPVKSLGVTTPDYQLQYEYTERGKGVVEGLTPRAAHADQVSLATDPDRECEVIAWRLKETLQLKRYHDAHSAPVFCVTRQRCRVRIETAHGLYPILRAVQHDKKRDHE
jgi:DNA topoisomerase-1